MSPATRKPNRGVAPLTIRISADARFKAGMDAMPGPAGAGIARAAPGGAVAGEPAGRRIVLVHAGSGGEARSWERLLRAIAPGQDCVAVARPAGHGDPAVQAAALRPLLVLRRMRRPLLIGCGAGAPVALHAALDFPDLVGGLLLVGASSAEPAPSGMLRRLAARLMPPAGRGGELHAITPRLPAIRVPVMLMQGADEPPGLGVGVLEPALTGCRTLTVVTVPGGQVLPGKHETAVRGALAALVGAVERNGR